MFVDITLKFLVEPALIVPTKLTFQHSIWEPTASIEMTGYSSIRDHSVHSVMQSSQKISVNKQTSVITCGRKQQCTMHSTNSVKHLFSARGLKTPQIPFALRASG